MTRPHRSLVVHERSSWWRTKSRMTRRGMEHLWSQRWFSTMMCRLVGRQHISPGTDFGDRPMKIAYRLSRTVSADQA